MLPPSTSASPAVQLPVRRRTGSGRWIYPGIFFIALIAVNLALEAWLPFPNVGEVSEKLAFFARHKDDFDAVFLGSSRVCRQIAPAVFDEKITEATGRPMRSFNCGAPSMFLPESLFVIDRLLAQRPARLRWMFIELNDPRPRLEEHAGLVRREVYWHGFGETALASMNILSARSIRWADRAVMLAHQWVLFGRRWTHLGRAQEWLAAGGDAVARNEAATLGPAGDGYSPYHATLGEGKDGGKSNLQDVRTFTMAAAALKAGHAKRQAPQKASALLRWLLAAKIRALRAHGIEPVFVIAPVTTDETEFLRLPPEGVVRPLLAFNDPAAYPELYEVNVRADTMHLNERGSVLFTRLLAGRFAEHLATAPPPPAR